jgi:hypothetical protein
VFGQVAHAGPVTLLAAGLERQQGQILGEAVQDCVGGTFFICIDLQVNVDGLPCVSARRAVSGLREPRSKANAKPNRQRAKCEAAGALSSPSRSGFVQQVAGANRRWRWHFRCRGSSRESALAQLSTLGVNMRYLQTGLCLEQD